VNNLESQVLALQLGDQLLELACGGVYQFSFKSGRRRQVIARLLSFNEHEIALQSLEGGPIFRRRLQDLKAVAFEI
jgi:hypothetical protein